MITIFKSHTGDQVMVDSNAEVAFGPVFGSDEDPLEFLKWLNPLILKDARRLDPSNLSELVYDWRKEVKGMVV